MGRQSDETTRTKLLDAAEKVFAEFGFEGASVRTINAEAQVDSGAIHYHFGTKQDLFRAVIQRRGEILSNDRIERLSRCVKAPGSPPLVEQIVAAYIMPYTSSALGSRDERLRFARLRARLMAEQPNNRPSLLGSEHKHTGEKFIKALALALPRHTRRDIRMRYLIMWSSLNTLSAGLGHTALEMPRSETPLLEFERNVPELIRLFAAMFQASSKKTSRSSPP
jgi:AcrR family transcriptional regulator